MVSIGHGFGPCLWYEPSLCALPLYRPDNRPYVFRSHLAVYRQFVNSSSAALQILQSADA